LYLKIMRKYAAKAKGSLHLGAAYIALIRAIVYDNLRYCRSALIGWSTYRPDPTHSEAQIIKLYHVIEKGLAMPDFRPRFGAPRMAHLVRWMNRFIDAGGRVENRHYASALRCLQGYRDVHRDLGIEIDDIITQHQIDKLCGAKEADQLMGHGGVDELGVEQFFSSSQAEYFEFAASRRSCRTFDQSKLVPLEMIEEAVESAIRTPSVCNRQAWKVHAYRDRETIDRLLSFQNGNAGFGHQIPSLLVLTMELKCFDGVIERYQPWIDGGMFAMSLLLALHHLQLGAVPLNWSVLPPADRGLREAGKLTASESIIMLVGVGFPEEKMVLPVSQRRLVDEVLVRHEAELK
jgi:nitroreductase